MLSNSIATEENGQEIQEDWESFIKRIQKMQTETE